MVHVDQDSRIEKVPFARRPFSSSQKLRTSLYSLLNLMLQNIEGFKLRERSDAGSGILRVADDVVPHFRNECVNEPLKERTRDIDSFHSATALAGIVEGAVHQVGYGKIEIGILADQGRILSSEFQTHIKQLGRGMAVYLAASLDGTSE